MKIIDDVIPEVMQNQLHEICIQPDFAWTFLEDATYDRSEMLIKKMDKPKYPSFSHLAMKDFRPRGPVAGQVPVGFRISSSEQASSSCSANSLTIMALLGWIPSRRRPRRRSGSIDYSGYASFPQR